MEAGEIVPGRAWRWRAETPADGPFLFLLFTLSGANAVLVALLPDTQRKSFLHSQWSAQNASYARAFPGAQRWIVEHGGDPVGRLLLHRSEEEWRVVDLALMPAARCMGLGTAILRRVQSEAAQAGRPLRLRVAVGNPAQRLYARMGFRVIESDPIREHLEWRATE